MVQETFRSWVEVQVEVPLLSRGGSTKWMLGVPTVCIEFGYDQDMSLRESYACFQQFLEFWVVWEHPDYFLLVVDYFVGAF